MWHLYLLALALGAAETLFDSAAQSIVPQLVAPDQLPTASSRLYGIEVIANTFLGPPLGGIIAAVSIAWAFTGSGAAYLLAALPLLRLPGRFAPDRAPGPSSVTRELREGLSYLWHHRLLLRLALLVGAVGLAFSAVMAVLPVWTVAPGPMSLTAGTFGLFLASTGVGALLASMTTEYLTRRLRPGRALRVAVIAMAVFAASPLIIQSIAVGLLFLVGGYWVVVWNVITVSYGNASSRATCSAESTPPTASSPGKRTSRRSHRRTARPNP